MEGIDKATSTAPQAVLGVLAVLVVAGALVPVRSEMGNTNVALVLVVVVVATAAAAGRLAGAAAAVMAALSFNFFHTEPYRSLRVDDRTDVVTVVLLLGVGLVVGELAARRITTRATASARLEGITGLHRVAELMSEDGSKQDVVAAVEREAQAALQLRSCRYEAGAAADDLPVLRHDGTVDTAHRVWAGTGFALPAEGAQLLVTVGRRHLGRLVLVPSPDAPAPLEERLLAVTLADQLALALARDETA